MECILLHSILIDEQKCLQLQVIMEMMFRLHQFLRGSDMNLYDGVQICRMKYLMMILQLLLFGEKLSQKISENDGVDDEEKILQKIRIHHEMISIDQRKIKISHEDEWWIWMCFLHICGHMICELQRHHGKNQILMDM